MAMDNDKSTEANRPASFREICDVAKKLADIFAHYSLPCCLTGDTACTLQGLPRRPHDLVVVVLSQEHTQERLKDMVIERDPDYYLIAPKDPKRAKHQALCYKLPRRPGERKRGCEVHILTPRVLNIPEVPKDRIETIHGLPVMPLPVLMFLRLQTWSDQRISVSSYMKSKQHDEDVEVIRELLAMTRGRGWDLSTKALLEWLPLTAVYAAVGRMTEFATEFPDTSQNWRVVGGLK